MKKRLLALALTLLLLPAPAALAKSAIPKALKFTQRTVSNHPRADITVKRTYPTTDNQTVTKEMRGVINDLTKSAQEKLPQANAYLDVGASVFRTGTQWMSFLTVARVVKGTRQTYVDCDARAYDMKTGRRLTLDDLFEEDSEAWPILEKEVREQLTAYFPEKEPDPEKLNALCAREAIRQAGFTLSPGKLSFHYRANKLYSGKTTLMHVDIYYPAIRPYMTQNAQKMTDASRYRLIALTYDDGPSPSRSMRVLDRLRKYGASATFFIIGSTIGNNYHIVCREHDAGHTVASHNYVHVYSDITKKNVKEWKRLFDEKLNKIIGRKATIMRAPGGRSGAFVKADCGLPLIRWSGATHDSPGSSLSAETIAATARSQSRDGAVLLMHDMNRHSPEYTESLLKTLESRNFLCVTVEELFSIYGVPLLPNHAYTGCEKQAKKQK